MIKTLAILLLATAVASASTKVYVENIKAIGEFTLDALNMTHEVAPETLEDMSMVLAELSWGQGCDYGSGRAQSRCLDLARRAFGNEYVKISKPDEGYNMDEIYCSITDSAKEDVIRGVGKTVVSEIVVYVKAALHCKGCKGVSSCHKAVDDLTTVYSCLNRVFYDAWSAYKAMVRGQHFSDICRSILDVIYTFVFKDLPACGSEALKNWINTHSATKNVKGTGLRTPHDVTRFVATIAVNMITSELTSLVSNLVAAVAAPGLGTSISAAKFGWKLYTFIRDCLWDVQATVRAATNLVGQFTAAWKTGARLNICAGNLASLLTNVFDTVVCYFSKRGALYKKMGCSSSTIRKFNLA